ncbi:MAG: DUF5679 domain-containing protein [Nitrososphaeraceae archaeon]
MATQAYCVKCKAKREMNNEKPVTMKNGRTAVSGVCSTCGTKMFKIGGGAASSPSSPSRKPKLAVKHASKKKLKKTVKQKKR